MSRQIRILQQPIEVRFIYDAKYGVAGREATPVTVLLNGPFTDKDLDATFDYNPDNVRELDARGIAWEFVDA